MMTFRARNVRAVRGAHRDTIVFGCDVVDLRNRSVARQDGASMKRSGCRNHVPFEGDVRRAIP